MSGTKKQYYVLSLKHTRGDLITWWGPNNSGYTRFLDKAGLYDEEEVEKKSNYLNDGETTLAIPVERVIQYMRRVVYIDNLSEVCGQHVYQTSDGLQTEPVFERENARRKKAEEERQRKIAAGVLCKECDGEGYHAEWCSKYNDEDDDAS